MRHFTQLAYERNIESLNRLESELAGILRKIRRTKDKRRILKIDKTRIVDLRSWIRSLKTEIQRAA